MHVDTLLRQAALESAWLDREHCLSLHVVGSQLAGWLSADASLMDNLHPTVAEARGNILTGYKPNSQDTKQDKWRPSSYGFSSL